MNQADTFSANTRDRCVDSLVNKSVLQQLAHDTSPEIIPELLTLYINDAHQQIEKIQIAIIQSDFKTLEFESHALSGSAVMHGNLRLHALAKKIERLCQKDDYEQILTCGTSLTTVANESFRLIEKYLSEMKAS